MKSILKTARLMASLASSIEVNSMRIRSTRRVAFIAAIACGMGIQVQAITIAVTYSFTGGPVGPEVMSGTILTLDHLSTGSVLSSNPSLNAIWNPFTLLSHDVVDFAALTLNGDSTITFADGSTLFGHQFVDFSNPLVPETLIFTGGTGEFAGATGLFSGESALLPDGFTVSGSGTINAPAIPEPAPMALILGGLVVIVARGRLIRQRG
jgi:hypothetical protein